MTENCVVSLKKWGKAAELAGMPLKNASQGAQEAH